MEPRETNGHGTQVCQDAIEHTLGGRARLGTCTMFQVEDPSQRNGKEVTERLD